MAPGLVSVCPALCLLAQRAQDYWSDAVLAPGVAQTGLERLHPTWRSDTCWQMTLPFKVLLPVGPNSAVGGCSITGSGASRSSPPAAGGTWPGRNTV